MRYSKWIRLSVRVTQLRIEGHARGCASAPKIFRDNNEKLVSYRRLVPPCIAKQPSFGIASAYPYTGFGVHDSKYE